MTDEIDLAGVNLIRRAVKAALANGASEGAVISHLLDTAASHLLIEAELDYDKAVSVLTNAVTQSATEAMLKMPILYDAFLADTGSEAPPDMAKAIGERLLAFSARVQSGEIAMPEDVRGAVSYKIDARGYAIHVNPEGVEMTVEETRRRHAEGVNQPSPEDELNGQ